MVGLTCLLVLACCPLVLHGRLIALPYSLHTLVVRRGGMIPPTTASANFGMVTPHILTQALPMVGVVEEHKSRSWFES